MKQCNISEHIFTKTNNLLNCEKCKMSYLEYVESLDDYAEKYRSLNTQ